MSQEEGEMGLDRREAELWNPQPWAQKASRKRPWRDTHTHSQEQSTRHMLANQGDVHRLITGRPRLVRGSTHRLTREKDRSGTDQNDQTHKV